MLDEIKFRFATNQDETALKQFTAEFKELCPASAAFMTRNIATD